MGKKGPPSKLESVKPIILDAVRAGNYFQTAAALAKISRDTLYDWIKQGKAGKEPYATFLAELRDAECEAEKSAIATLRTMPQNWQALAWFLERRHPKRWARRDADYKLKSRLLLVEIETLKAKLKVLEAGINPDAAQPVMVVVPELAEIARDPEPR